MPLSSATEPLPLPGLSRHGLRRGLALVLLTAGLAACGSTPVRHTLYLPAPPAQSLSHAPVVRVSLPVYADGRRIYHRGDSGRLMPWEGHAWAEPPADGFARLLVEQLAAGAAARAREDSRPDNAAPHREAGLFNPRQVLRVRFTRFDIEADGHLRARGVWRLSEGADGVGSGILVFDAPDADASAEASVAAMSQAVQHVAEAIRDAVARGHNTSADPPPTPAAAP